MSGISCRQVTKSFGTTLVLDRLDFDVPDGSIATVLGASGSGKTTLLRLLAGFDRPDTGEIRLDDDVVDGPQRFVPPEKRRIGYVAQEGNLFPHLDVARNVTFGVPRRERTRERATELLELVGLEELGGRYPHQLSGGQQQRAALARALAPRPRLVLLDEPFSSLDAGLRASLRMDVVRILRAQETTAVLVTHDQAEALSVADLVAVMSGGRIRQVATPERLYTRPADPEIASFLGEANLVEGTIDGSSVDTVLGRLHLLDGATGEKGPAIVLIRPEQLSLQTVSPANGTGRAGAAAGHVAQREYYGHDCVLLVAIENGHPLRLRYSGPAPAEVGDHVTVSASGPVVAWPARNQRPARVR